MPGHGAFASRFDPHKPPRQHPAFWSPATTGAIVIVDCDSGFLRSDDASAAHHCRAAADGRHRVVRTARATLRLWIRDHPGTHIPAFQVPIDALGPARLAATRQAQLWLEGAAIEAGDGLSVFQAARFDLMLRLLDARASGAHLRALARIAYPALPALSAAQWKASSERRGTQRLLLQAEQLRDGGYRALLRGA